VLALGRRNANANITVTAQRAARNSAGLPLDEQVRGVEKQLANTVPQFEKESTTDTMLAGRPAKQILYTGAADNFLIKFKQVFLVVNDILYFVCIADDATKFASSERDADDILHSFTVK